MRHRNQRLYRRICVILAVLVIGCMMCTTAFASSNSAAASTESTTDSYKNYIRSWSDWTQQKKPAYTDDGKTWKFHDIKDAILQVLDAGKAAMEAGDYTTARQAGSDGYYGFYDLAFENATNMYISGSRVKQLELLFGNLRGLADDHDVSGFEKVSDQIEQYVQEDADKLDGEDLDEKYGSGSSKSTSDDSTSNAKASSSSGSAEASTGAKSATMLVFLGTFFDILREGFEAIIVVGAIVAYLQAQVRNEGADKKKTLYPVYFGALLGIVCSFIMAAILNFITTKAGSSSHQQEFIEGITALLAVCVLFWTCNWMLSKSETEAWTAYIKDKTQTGAQKGSVFALALASFLAVFREGAEAVLFLQPYMRNEEQRGGVIWGLIVAAICLVIIYLLIHLLSVKIPMRIFFNATSILMAVMCVCFLGAGISELIEAEVFNAYSAPWVAWIPLNNSVLDVLGIYPYVNTIVPQIILAVVLIIMFHIGFKKNRAIRKEAEAKKAEEDARIAAEEKAKADEEFRRKVTDIVLSVLADPDAAKKSLAAGTAPKSADKKN